MALSRTSLSFAVMAIFFFSLTLLKTKPEAYSSSKDEAAAVAAGLRKMILGSRPPACVNRCMNCRPCEATLVIPPHNKMKKTFSKSYRREEDDSYYLLSWKCRCGDKLFQP